MADEGRRRRQEQPPPPSVLPLDLIFDVLTKVPTESLVRFRCVCKSWYDLISNNHVFIDSHMTQTQRFNHQKKNQGFIFSINSYELIIFDINKNQHKEHIIIRPLKDFNLKDEKKYGFHCVILGSLNGLLFISCSYNTPQTYAVFNPITRRSIILPDVDFVGRVEGSGIFSLVYDSIGKKYKVVYCGYDSDIGYYGKIIDVGGGEGNVWRDVVIPKPHRLRGYPPVFANGSLHWMLDSIDVENLDKDFAVEAESVGKVLTMDVARETFYTINHPTCTNGVYSLLERRGLLCFIDHVSNTELKLWILKDLQREEWELEYNVDLGHLEGSLPFNGFCQDSFPFALPANPKSLMIIKCNKEANPDFYWYDLEQKQFGTQKLEIDPEWLDYDTDYEQKFFPLLHVNSLAYF